MAFITQLICQGVSSCSIHCEEFSAGRTYTHDSYYVYIEIRPEFKVK